MKEVILKRAGVVLGIAAVHFVISFFALVYGVSSSMSQQPLPFFLRSASGVLFFPISLIKSSFSSETTLFSFTAFNSLIWGIAICGFYCWFRRLRK